MSEKPKYDAALTAVLRFAEQHAQNLNPPRPVTTGHLLLALVQEKSSLSAVFTSLGISKNDIGRAVSAIDKRTGDVQNEEGYSAPARHALERAAQVANERSSVANAVLTPIDLLLGLLPAPGAEVLDGDDFTAVLIALGSDTKKVLQAVQAQVEKAGKPLSNSTNQAENATPTLEKYARNLNAWGESGKLAPCTWRGKEIAKIIEILGQRLQNNPILVGETGVGTVSVVEGLVLQILSGNVPDSLKAVRIFQLDMTLATSGTKYRGEFEERLYKIIEEVQADGNIILLFEDLHTIVGAGRIGEGGSDAASILKPKLARGELRCIGTTSPDEYRTHIEQDNNLNGLLQQVKVDELSVEDTVAALQAVKHLYEEHHGVTYKDETLLLAAQLSDRYLHTTKLPGKAIQLIDRAGSRVKNARSGEADHNGRKVVAEADITEIVVGDTGIPLASLTKTEADKLLGMAEALHQGIIGQEKAVESVQSAFWRLRVGLKPPNRPIASFFFLGPTGVGKTELARELARYLFDTEDALIRLDMSEYMERSSVSKLIGTSAGFVGYKDPGQLTEPVRSRPYCVLLLDEIEKADPAVLNLLLQVLDAGRLTDGAGRVVDFKNVVVIATSNVGSKVIIGNTRAIGIDLGDKAPEVERKSGVLEQELAQKFSPEFLNRWDEVIEFDKLGEAELELIVQLSVKKIFAALEQQWNIQLVLSPQAAKFVVKRSDPKYGARPLARILQKSVETPLAEGILRGDYQDCDVHVYVDGDKLALKKVARK
jgi:ATP-dependent Clp protease ATP-binding subunit ClpC